MPLSIRNSEVERLARALSRLTGEGLTQTILQALRERYQRVRTAREQKRLMEATYRHRPPVRRSSRT